VSTVKVTHKECLQTATYDLLTTIVVVKLQQLLPKQTLFDNAVTS